ncbi:DYW family of nucleic acid deaminase domain-containing protein [Forsythia ovata]|uniref:DYW family of nucleic acid deaminase domain-containing protein n=1 Tax=Forsythia ovata TaxID=205694 RepID=A0ABD1Q1C2_9LAMI
MAGNIIINMYAKCGDLLGSRRVFKSMRTKDSVSWNSLMNGYIENELYYEAMEFFRRMRMDLQPDSVTYVTLFCNCTQLINMEWAKELHCDLIKQGFDFAQIVGNALVDVYDKCGAIEDSLKQFENIEIRDIVSWNTIITASGHIIRIVIQYKLTPVNIALELETANNWLEKLPLSLLLKTAQEHSMVIKQDSERLSVFMSKERELSSVTTIPINDILAPYDALLAL